MSTKTKLSQIIATIIEVMDDKILRGSMGEIGGLFEKGQHQTLVVFEKQIGKLFSPEEVEYLRANHFFLLAKRVNRKECAVYDWTAMFSKDEELERIQAQAREAERIGRTEAKRLALLRAHVSKEKTLASMLEQAMLSHPNVRLDAGSFTDKVKPGKGNLGVPLLFLSDLHYSEVVQADQIDGMNAYDVEIANKRINRVFENTHKMLSSHLKADHGSIVVAMGGDMISGDIHEELKETNDLRTTEAVFNLADRLALGLKGLASEFKTVHVPCVVGNHGRLTKKPTAKNFGLDNWDYVLYTMIAQQLKREAPNVIVHPTRGMDLDFQIFNTRYKLTHGNQFKSNGGIGGIWPSLMRGNANRQKRAGIFGQTYDFLMMGHFHQLGYVEDLIVNGSVKGYDEYASSKGLPFERARQALWLTHPEEGRTITSQVFADEDPARSKQRSVKGTAFHITA
ncbi:hypothetical protein A6M27_15175 [Acidithiobacillus thiooxidans]|uniref:Calcineurin-like phosphoesterase domain-containing protein n=2 Tax=Acidithiobacillus thiooxidans TaxID=930 RepID=A0A1C2JB11_ACITH|nr:hypothetical protein [Acidithiobacillus thiooxidans]OCX72829.1 hypothetical protein A6P07_09410 [Acidithiobacillus thiooxidans]OCX83483.1 hypothetical protein A6O26_07065 [Acidithiobacillus thiooxidans]OCX85423.1 hypothetical protein A6M27_15175 [Acidithiobacillus thiooxidans]